LFIRNVKCMNQRTRNIILFIGISILIFLLFYFRNIVAYILIAAVLSLIGRPLMRGIQRIPFGKKKHLGKMGSALITLLLMLALTIGFLAALIPLVAMEIKDLSAIDITSVMDYLDVAFAHISNKIPHFISYGDSDSGMQDYIQGQLANMMNLGQVTNLFSSVAGTLGNMFLMFFSVSFILFFFLKEEQLFSHIILVFVPRRYEEKVSHVMTSINHLLKRYFIGIVLEVLGVMTLETIGFSVVGLGFNHGLVVGVFAGIMNVIPYIGPWIGGAFGILVAIATHLNQSFPEVTLPLILLVILVVVIVQLVDNVVFQPVIYSNSVRAHPLEIFLVILMAGSFAGIAGMILAIPVYTVLRVIAREFLSQFRLVRELTSKMKDD